MLAFALIAALRRRRLDLAKAMLADALAIVPSVKPISSCARAHEGLWRVCLSLGDRTMQNAVLASVLAHVHPDRSWRACGFYREIVATLAWDRPDQADAVVRAMPQGKARDY